MSGGPAAAAVLACQGLISEASATDIITRTTEALLALEPDPCAGNLWPHFVRDVKIVLGTEWSSIDTVIAAELLIDVRKALGLDTGPAVTFLSRIG